MPTVRVELSPEKLLEATEQLSSAELEQFLKQVLALHARRKAPSLTRQETDLLMTINTGLPPNQQSLYKKLIEKRRAYKITEEELKQLLTLTDEVERLNVERVKALIELAQIRGISLTELMDNLGIKTPPVL